MFRTPLLALGFSLFAYLICAERVRYDNYNIYQVIPRTLNHVQLLERFEAYSDSLIFLNPTTAVDKSVNILVAPHKQPDFLIVLSDNQLDYELIEENFQRTLDIELDTATPKTGVYDWTGYHTLDETYDWLRSLAKKYPNYVQLVIGGRTYEGRQIEGVKVSYKSGNKGIFIEGGIHAREWISPATVTYILNEILSSTNVKVRAIAESFDWYVFPHTNPDGYVYTHKNNRLWRKTRSKSSMCYGADPNRNWGFHWKEIGASSFECAETYAGKSAFSEVETRSFSEFLKTLVGKIHTYLSFHSYSQLILFPYGHTEAHAANHDDLQRISEIAATALSRRYGTKYIVGNSNEAIYPTSGTSVDWVYSTLNVSLSYTYELRPASSSTGFVLPSSQILPTCLETLDSLIALIEEADNLGYYK